MLVVRILMIWNWPSYFSNHQTNLWCIFHNVFACNSIDVHIFCYPFFTFISQFSSSLIRNSLNEVFVPVSHDGSSNLAEFNPSWFIEDNLVLPSLLLPSFLNILVEAKFFFFLGLLDQEKSMFCLKIWILTWFHLLPFVSTREAIKRICWKICYRRSSLPGSSITRLIHFHFVSNLLNIWTK